MTPGAKFSRKGTKLSVLDWPVNHPFTKTFISKPPIVQRKGTNPPVNITTDIQSLINEGEKKVPTWHKRSTNLLHKKIVYLLSILALCSEPISLNDLMKFMKQEVRCTGKCTRKCTSNFPGMYTNCFNL
ncbi:MAG: hypothetical protein NTY96_13330 [Bacteroidetes bacterium]|nr:hypothetical protein [Bacteroidota bacterium]